MTVVRAGWTASRFRSTFRFRRQWFRTWEEWYFLCCGCALLLWKEVPKLSVMSSIASFDRLICITTTSILETIISGISMNCIKWTADTSGKQKALRTSVLRALYKKVAATYSPTWWGSTIGDGELNFSVRNGKRWILTAITATICFWEKISRNWLDAYRAVFHLFSWLISSLLQSLRLYSVTDQSKNSQRKMSGY